ncbi:MAG TPA: adenylate/guanylate cyclase domain-containing protein [Solirubrobacteraceae bacterium]|nr:adenylate/guanylate cyclase domain-containing protein [Solirubrobacteraceae bacterium]
MEPETRYARSGDVHIAYQVAGTGPFDLVFVPGFVTHLELAWRLPSFGRVLAELASFSRLIKFDKRGTGMSDPVQDAPTLETRMDDVRAVMDAAGSRRAALFGLSEGASLSVLFAATYPERTAALVLRSAAARTLWAPDYPWGSTEEAYRRRMERELRIFGPREQALEAVEALGVFGDGERESFLDYLRYGASPGMLEALLRMNREIDIRDVLGAVRVPTLVLHGSEDGLVPVEAGRHLAERIPGAEFVELPGVGHLAVNESAGRIDRAIRSFLTGIWTSGGWEEPEPDRVLATVLFTDIVGSTRRATELGDREWLRLRERHHALVRRELARFRGREIDTAGDGFLAAFDGPARAIRCASSVVRGVRELGLDVRAGLHCGECEVADGKIAGIAVHIGARVASHAGAGEVVVSSTVRDLVAGSGITFADRGVHELRGVPGAWRLFAVAGA